MGSLKLSLPTLMTLLCTLLIIKIRRIGNWIPESATNSLSIRKYQKMKTLPLLDSLVSNKLYAKNYFKRWLKMDRICSLHKSLKIIYSCSLEKKFQYFIQSVLFYNLPLKYMIGLLLRLFFFWMIKQILVRHYGRFLLWDPTKKGQWVLHVYTIATYVVSWLKWLQMNLNEFKWPQWIF